MEDKKMELKPDIFTKEIQGLHWKKHFDFQIPGNMSLQ